MASVEKVSVVLSSDLLEAVKSAVESGEYASASEVFGEALREWQLKKPLRQTEVERLRQAWHEGLASGEPKPLDMNDIKRRARRAWEAQKALLAG